MSTAVDIPEVVLRKIAAHVMASPAEEVCGLLAGEGNRVTKSIPVPNNAQQPRNHFSMAPELLLRHLKALDDAALEWIGTYHSHPGTDTFPSKTDIAHARQHLPERVMLIASARGREITFQAWQITQFDVEHVDISNHPVINTGKLPPAVQITTIMSMVSAVIILIIIAISLLPPAPDLSAL